MLTSSLHPRHQKGWGSSPRWRKVLLALVLALQGVFVVAPSSADDLSNKENQRNQVNALMAQLRAQMATAQNQEAVLQGVIDKLGTQIAATEHAMNAAQAQLAVVDGKLADAQDHLITVQAQLRTDKQALAQQIITEYEMGNSSTTLSNILSSSDVNDFIQRIIDARHVAEAGQALSVQVLGEEHDVQTTVAQIASEKAQQQGVLQRLHQESVSLDDQLYAQQQARAYLAQVVAQDQVKLQQAEQALKQLNAEIAALQAEQARAGGTGQFMWPLSGPITQPFGCTPYYFEPYDPNCSTRHFHSGIDIAAGCYTPIRAADTGIVNEYWSSYGYGDHIIMVHGNGWTSVYGHMASFAVGNGVQVTRGTVIGYEGSTGNSTGCHLHFEVRYNNDPRNPLAYLP